MTLITYPGSLYVEVKETFDEVCKLVNRVEFDGWLILTDADGGPIAVNIGNAACIKSE